MILVRYVDCFIVKFDIIMSMYVRVCPHERGRLIKYLKKYDKNGWAKLMK